MTDKNASENLDLVAALEALLFIYGAPMAIVKAAKTLAVSGEELAQIVTDLEQRLAQRKSGLVLMQHGETLQLITRPDLATIVEVVIKTDLKGPLTPSSLETLTIVAYAGPIARAEIDYIRGVNSSFTLRSLLLRGLITRTQIGGGTYEYGLSSECLKYFGVAKVADLPGYSEHSEILNRVNEYSETEEI